jgi:two-component system, NtrC family, response regulator HydG
MNPKVLVVDDEESVRYTFSRFLFQEGYEVFTAETSDDALRVLSDEKIDLVLADIVLGDRSGTELLKEVKGRGLNCPVIMITGQPTVKSAAESVREGAFDYVPKPIQKETLLRISKMALDRKKLVEEKERYRKNLEAIFRSMKDAIITVDNDMRVLEANEATRDICGVVPGEIIGKPYKDSSAQCLMGCLPVLQETIRGKTEIREHRVQCAHALRPDRSVVINSSPLLDGRDQVSGAVLTIRDVTRLSALERELKVRDQFQRIIGKSGRIQDVFGLLEDLGPTDTTVLITGESGTGKEMVARALHQSGRRAFKPLVNVSCSALAETLLESELFGHVKGAFTGAVANKKGRFQAAEGGTIFLDEIAEISPLIQMKLLRVLQEREFEKVGDSAPVKADVRVIAATNRNLKERVSKGLFREDLYYRLKVVEISLPPLRERAEDIPLLSEHFCEKFNRIFRKSIQGIHDNVLELFMRYSWPGNVRELEHAIEHAFVLCHEEIILPRHVPSEILKQGSVPSAHPAGRERGADGAQEIAHALKRSGWNKAGAARLLGVSRQTLYRKLREHGLSSSPPAEFGDTHL